MANRRLCKELDDFEASADRLQQEGFSAALVESNLFHWRATVRGPAGTPYEGGTFVIDLRFPLDYPFKPPHVAFVTRIYHPNVRVAQPGDPPSSGGVCLDVLADHWCPALTTANILTCVVGLLADPCPADQEAPLLPDVAEVYRTDRAQFEATALEWTSQCASPVGGDKPP